MPALWRSDAPKYPQANNRSAWGTDSHSTGMIDVADIEAKARRMRDTIVRQQGFGQ
jgi:hypothetical protein